MNVKRFVVLMVAFIILSGFLSARLMYISVFKNAKYSEAVDYQQTNVISVGKARGNIYDRNGIPLTGSEKTCYSITENGEIVSGNEGVISFPFTVRYGEENPASHIVGYVNGDGEGVSGAEKLCNKYLKSDEDVNVVFKGDAMGRPFDDSKVHGSFDNENIRSAVWLSLDLEIQKIVEEVMNKTVSKGAVVILDCRSFELIAMASRPDFDRNNPLMFFEREDSPLLNRALCEYNAGSVFKIVVTAAALDNDMKYADTKFLCRGFSEGENKQVFKCHKEDGHGELDFVSAFARSCNCAFYETGICVGGEKICDMAKRLGLGSLQLGAENEESAGKIPYAQSYTDSQLMNISIGQGDVMITPLQCAVMTATVANGGIRKKVRFVNGTQAENEEIRFAPDDREEIIVMEREVAAKLGTMMRECVISGTGSGASACDVSIAGKTGSAETGWQNEDGSFKEHGWFCGFFPYENPKYAMAILCEDGKSGAGSCVEPFVEICNKINEICDIKE